MIISPNRAKLFDANISKVFDQEFNQYDEYKQFVQNLTSKRQFEEVTMVSEVPLPSKVGELEDFPMVEAVAGPTRRWVHEKYGFELIASKEAIDDELFPVIVNTGKAAATAMRHRLEIQGVYDYDMAFTANSVGPYDTPSETLCATSHATFVGAGGATQANRPDTDITLGVDSLWAAIDNFASLTDREGQPIVKIPRKLMTNAVNKRVCKEILDSMNMPYSMNREDNVLKSEGITPVYSHYLISPTAWFLMTDTPPVWFYTRQPVTIEAESRASNQSRAWILSMRISHGPRTWEDVYGSTGA